MKDVALILIGVIIGVGAMCFYQSFQPPTEPKIVVETVHDTITDYRPTLINASKPLANVTAKLAIADRRRDTLPEKAERPVVIDEQPEADEETAEPPDSVEVIIPITQKTFAGANYRAYVSGYNQNLDSISIFTERQIITQHTAVKTTPKRWGLGVTAGYGYTPQGFQPYIGIGVSYNLICF